MSAALSPALEVHAAWGVQPALGNPDGCEAADPARDGSRSPLALKRHPPERSAFPRRHPSHGRPSPSRGEQASPRRRAGGGPSPRPSRQPQSRHPTPLPRRRAATTFWQLLSLRVSDVVTNRAIPLSSLFTKPERRRRACCKWWRPADRHQLSPSRQKGPYQSSGTGTYLLPF